MTDATTLIQVGAPDPELRNSLIIAETDEDFGLPGQDVNALPICYFNDVEYRHGDLVCSGSELLRCDKGVWLMDGNCDPEHV